MNRRSFLQALAAGLAGAATIDLDALVWTPGARTIFVPPAGGWITKNTRVTPSVVVREALRQLARNLKFPDMARRAYQADPPLRLGDVVLRGTDPLVVDRFAAVDLRIGRDGCVGGPEALAAIFALEQEVRRLGITETVIPEVPPMVSWAECCASSSMCVRGMAEFDIEANMPVMRLDVLGGRT